MLDSKWFFDCIAYSLLLLPVTALHPVTDGDVGSEISNNEDNYTMVCSTVDTNY